MHIPQLSSKRQWLVLFVLAALAVMTVLCAAAAKAEIPKYVGRPLSGSNQEEIIARNSPLTEYVHLSPRSDSREGAPIDTITIHYMAGDLSLEEVGEVFSRADRAASANYVIDSDGRVGLYVEETQAARTSGNEENDRRAVNIEVANDEVQGRWHVSDEAFASLVTLVTDICIRNGIERLDFTGDTSGNLTLHWMFRDTTCPGSYLLQKMPSLVSEVNRALRPHHREATE